MKRRTIFLSLIASSVLMTEAIGFDGTNAKIVQFSYSLTSDSFYSGTDKDFNNYYKYYNEGIVNTDLEIPLDDNMIPQGITLYNDYILTTSYNYNKQENSCVYVLSKNGELINTCELPNKAHVGGIAYDKVNDLVWICGVNGCIDAYKPYFLLRMKEAYPMYANLDVGDGLPNYKNFFLNSVSYLAVDGNDIYVGSFSLKGSGLVKKYTIGIDEETMTLTLKFKKEFKVPKKVQGLTFYEKDDQKYIIFSRSYGKYTPSVLQIFKYDDEISSYDNSLPSVSYEAPTMMEQITCDQDLIYSIFESGADYYKDGLDKISNIHVLDSETLVRRLK